MGTKGARRGIASLATFTFFFHSATSVATRDGLRSIQESSEAYLHPTYVLEISSYLISSRVVADLLMGIQVSYRHSRIFRKILGNTPFTSPPFARRFASMPTHARTSSALSGHISSRRRCINSKMTVFSSV